MHGAAMFNGQGVTKQEYQDILTYVMLGTNQADFLAAKLNQVSSDFHGFMSAGTGRREGSLEARASLVHILQPQTYLGRLVCRKCLMVSNEAEVYR